MQAILDAIEADKLNARVRCVFANTLNAPALSLAHKYGIMTAEVSHKGLTREQHETHLLDVLLPLGLDFVVLAGYMRVLSPAFLNNFADPAGYNRVINIHPSLLPAFPGAKAYEEAFAYGVRISGVTVHLAANDVDAGPILGQETFPRYENDTFEAFVNRGLEVEHKLYPRVLQQIAHHGIRLMPHSNREVFNSYRVVAGK
jgi:phosphoribosylglycinamide formyltransferase-1